MSLMPKQTFEFWLVVCIADYNVEEMRYYTSNEFFIAGTQRMPSNDNDFITVFIPFIDGFTTIHARDIYFKIRTIHPKK